MNNGNDAQNPPKSESEGILEPPNDPTREHKVNRRRR